MQKEPVTFSPEQVAALLALGVTVNTPEPVVTITQQVSPVTTPTTPDQDDVINAEQVASMLKLAPSAVYRLARENRIPNRRISPRRILFSRAAVLAWWRGGASTLFATPEEK